MFTRITAIGLIVVVFGCGNPLKPGVTQPDEGVKIKTAQVARTQTPIIVRGDCKLTTTFYYDYMNSEKTHYSVHISQPDPRASIHAYILRESEDGKKLFDVLGGGATKKLTLEIRIGDHVEVAELVRVVRYE